MGESIEKKVKAAGSSLLMAASMAALFALSGCASSAESPPAAGAPALPPASAVSSAQVREPAEIRALDLVAESGAVAIELVADRPLVWTSFRDAQGDLVIELPNSLPGTAVSGLERGSGLVSEVEVETLEDSTRPLTRLVVRTREPSEHSLAGDGDTLRIQLAPVAPGETVAIAYEPLSEEEPAREPRTAPPPPLTTAPPPAVVAAAAEPETQLVGTPEEPLRAPPPEGVAASQLYLVRAASPGSGTVVEVLGDGEFDYSTFYLENPDRFVIDLTGVVNNSPDAVVTVESEDVGQVRVGQFKPRPEPVARVVFDLHRSVFPTIERSTDGLLVRFGGEVPAIVAEAAPPMAEPVETPPEPEPMEAPAEPMVVEAPPEPEPMEPEPEPVVVEALPEPEPVVVEAPPEPEPMEPEPEPMEPEPVVVEALPEPEPVVVEAPPEPEPMEPEPVVVEAPPEPRMAAAPSPEVPVYEPEPLPAAPPAPLPPPAQTADVAMFEAQEVMVEPTDERSDELMQTFGTLVVSRQEREYFGEPIDMSLKQADLVETLRSFATISGLNFVIQPGVTGTVTVELKGVPWDQAMEQVLKINNLGMDIDGTIVRIAPMEQLRAEAEEERQLQEARQQSVPLRTVLRSLSYSNANEIAALLRNRTGSLLSSRGTVQVDQRTNTLILRELPEAIDTVLAVIDNLDAPEPQVTIEARIIEATKSFSRTLGIEWGYDFEANAANGNTTGLTFPNTVDTDGGIGLLTGGANGFINMRLGSILDTFNLDARLQVAENEGLVNLVSAPRVTTLNNTAATIQSGVQIPIQTVSNRTVSVQFVNATLQLQVTPQVTAEGTIMMQINVAKRSPAPGLAIVGATNPPIQTREAQTKVIVRDGGTTVIGGIYEVSANNVQDRVPGLVNIPILGHLFKNRNRSNSNDELMIFITPRIVQM